MRWHGWKPPCATTSDDCSGDRRSARGRGAHLRPASALRRCRAESVAKREGARAGSRSAIDALREIEFDRATGKLSDDDYAALKAEYTRTALVELRAANRPIQRVARSSRPWPATPPQCLTCQSVWTPPIPSRRLCCATGPRAERARRVGRAPSLIPRSARRAASTSGALAHTAARRSISRHPGSAATAAIRWRRSPGGSGLAFQRLQSPNGDSDRPERRR